MNLYDFDDSAIRQTNVHKISKISPKNATISPAEIFPGHLPLSTADPTQWKHFGRITSNLGRCSTTLRPNTYAIITTENTPNAINQSQPTKNKKEVGRRILLSTSILGFYLCKKHLSTTPIYWVESP